MARFALIGARGYPSYYGGFETLIRRLAPYLVSKGHEVTVYGRTSRRNSSSLDVGGVHVRNVPVVDSKSLSTITYGFTATREATKAGFDAALVLNVALGYYLKRLGNAGIPTVVNVDGLEWQRAKWGRVGKAVFRGGALLTERHAQELVIDSEALRKYWDGRRSRRARFIPYGADVVTLRDASLLRQANLPESGYVLVVARLVPENNVDLLLDAVELLPRRPTVIVVGGANYGHATTERIGELSRNGQVVWLGHVSDQALLEALWAHAGVYWHGHSVGGTNPALLQALGAGAPTVALDTPFNREVIPYGSHLVEHDALGIARRIATILADPTLAKHLGRIGQERVKNSYSWSSVCGQYEELLLELALNPTSSRR